MTASRNRQAANQRAYRIRQRKGVIVARAPLNYDQIAVLIDAGVLSSQDEDDPAKIGEGVSKLISALAKERYR